MNENSLIGTIELTKSGRINIKFENDSYCENADLETMTNFLKNEIEINK